MSSLYAEYLKERTSDNIMEDNRGFVTWRYLNDTQVYIVDIFVRKEFRNKGIAADYADFVCAIAKKAGYSEVIGSIIPSAKGSNASLRVLWGYGMILHSADKDLIIMKKDL